MKRNIFLILAILILVVLGYQVFGAYLANHTYYLGDGTNAGMIGSATNRKVLLWAILTAAIPVSYLLFMKKKSLKRFAIAAFVGLFIYAVAESVVKQDILGPGFLLLLFKYAILCGIIVYFLVGLLSVGTWLRKKIFGHHDRNIEQIFLNIGLGLIVFCLVNYALILFHLFYGIVIALLFVGLGLCAWFMRKQTVGAVRSLEEIMNQMSWSHVKNSPRMMIFVLLALFSFVYLHYGFVLSDIPYPTAWDANHAYMYFPKIWAANSGFYREGGLMTTPNMWLSYITFWFKFVYIFGKNTWISADNVAVIMNFLSGIFTLTFGIVLVREVITFIHGKNENKPDSIFLAIGWFLLLLWLTSGMGAFLVFVDNKTDLGVMALTILALYSGFFFLNQLREHKGGAHSLHYVVLSGLFFAGAVLAKPTATFDVINFAITLITLWFGALLAFGLFLLLLGILGKSAILTVQKFLTNSMIDQLLIAGGALGVLGIVSTWWKKQWKNARYLFVWGAVIIAILVVVKGPYLLVKQIKIEQNISPIKLVKDIFLTYTHPSPSKKPILLTSRTSYQTLLAVDDSVMSNIDADDTSGEPAANPTVASCMAKDISTTDLYKDLKTPPGSALNEDVGRYIGYGWKTFDRPWRGFLFAQGCHGWNKDAVILCENTSVLDDPDLAKLDELYQKLPEGSQAKELLSGVLASDVSSVQLAANMRDLKAYYQDKSWMKKDGVVSLPFTMLVPFNITFNWSLQNLTSYYTDIGVIWLLCLFLIILGFIYSIIKWNKSLFAVTLSTLCGWGLWWVAGGAILWYSLGVVIWTVIATTLVLYALGQNSKGVQKNLFILLAVVFAFIGLYQLLLNFIRISSQGGGGPFVWYRANVGNVNSFDQNLIQQTKQKIGYNDKDVFNMQFGHYNTTISILDARDDEEGVIIAGTYLPYFLMKQTNLVSDGFLVDLWKNLSDNDPCNTYLRLVDQSVKYIVIDPNIASVVMGDANSALMDRIFGKLDPAGNSLVDYGSLTMIVKMVEEGYMSLATTNIISAKYAFELSKEELAAAFPEFPEDDVVLRAKLATLRFWPNANQMFARLPAIFTQRLVNMKAIGDLAAIFGKDVDVNKLQSVAKTVLNSKTVAPDLLKDVSQDERAILVQYLSLYNLMKTNNQQYQQYLSNVMQQSVLGGSQVLLFERN